MDKQTFQTWLKAKLQASGMSAQEFADKAKISKPLVYFYLTGKRVPTPTTMTRIMEALGTQDEDVMQFARKGLGRPPKTS